MPGHNVTHISLHFGNFLAISEIWHNSAGASSVFCLLLIDLMYIEITKAIRTSLIYEFDYRWWLEERSYAEIGARESAQRVGLAARQGRAGQGRAGQERAAVAGCQLPTLIKTPRRRRRDTDRIINKDFEPRLLRRSFAVLTCSELFNETKTEKRNRN